MTNLLENVRKRRTKILVMLAANQTNEQPLENTIVPQDQDLGHWSFYLKKRLCFQHIPLTKILVIGPPTLKKRLLYAFFQVGGPMTKILVLRNKRVFKGLFIHLIDSKHDQDLGAPFSHVFKQVGHWSTCLEKKNASLDVSF